MDPAFTPYVQTLNQLGENDFNDILIQEPNREGSAGLMLDIAQAFLQRAEGFASKAIDSI